MNRWTPHSARIVQCQRGISKFFCHFEFFSEKRRFEKCPSRRRVEIFVKILGPVRCVNSNYRVTSDICRLHKNVHWKRFWVFLRETNFENVLQKWEDLGSCCVGKTRLWERRERVEIFKILIKSCPDVNWIGHVASDICRLQVRSAQERARSRRYHEYVDSQAKEDEYEDKKEEEEEATKAKKG